MWKNALMKRLEFFAGLEAHGFPGRNADLGAGAGIAPNAGLARLDREDPESSKLDSITPLQSLLHGSEDGFNGDFGFCAGDTRAVYDSIDDVGFNQFSFSPRKGSVMLEESPRDVKRFLP